MVDRFPGPVRCLLVHLLLPPSETKTVGGAAVPTVLSFPELEPTRKLVREALIRVSADPVAARAALKVSAALDQEVAANLVLDTAPTLPALARYTGVLFSALDPGSMTRVERSRADERLVVTSALFGLVRAGDRIPAYRASAGSRLPGLQGLPAVWRETYTAAAGTLDGPVIDLRSGAYAAFGAVPGAIAVRVVTEGPGGTRLAVSHDNKAAKGRFARLLATSRAEIGDVSALLRVARRAGWRIDRAAGDVLELVV